MMGSLETPMNHILRLFLLTSCLVFLGVIGAKEEEVTVVRFQQDGLARDDTMLTYLREFPNMTDFSICFRVRLRQLRELSNVISYAVPEESNEIMLGFNQKLSVYCCGNFKDQYDFSITLRQWMSLCIALDLHARTIKILSNGNVIKKNMKVSGNMALTVRGGGIFVIGQDQDSYDGGYSRTQSLCGTLTDLMIFDEVLSDDDMKVFGQCESSRTMSATPIINFSDVQRDFQAKNVIVLKEQKEDYCNFRRDKLIVFSEPQVFDNAKHICNISGGELEVPRGSGDNWLVFAKALPFAKACNSGSIFGFWLGVMGVVGTQSWIHYNSEEALDYTNFVTQSPIESPSLCVGFVGDNSTELRQHGAWQPIECEFKACPICHLDKVVLLKARGLCKDSLFDRDYFLTQETGSVYFTGMYYSVIKRHPPLPDGPANASDHGFWRLSVLHRPSVTATLQMNSPSHYPFGRNVWAIDNDVCGTSFAIIAFTSCKEGQFTCSDGSCIKIEQRCDMEVDCPSGSDEMGCNFVTLDPSYNGDNPPPREDVSKPVRILIHLDIYAIQSIDVDEFSFTCEIEVTTEWIDSRLRFQHLNFASELNSLTGGERKPWTPMVEFLGDRQTTSDVIERRVSLNVRRRSNPLPDNDEEQQESEVFAGDRNSLVQVQKLTVTTPCQFYLEKFPFDKQVCSMGMLLSSITKDYVALDPGEMGVTFNGRRKLLEYVLVEESIVQQDVGNYSGLEVRLYLHNLSYYYITSTYVPTLIIVVIGYLVFYFPIGNFNERIMVGLTGLLVEATFFSQVNSSIPHTAYMKLVDIWMVFCILILFQVVVSVVIIHWVLEKMVLRNTTQVVSKGFHRSIPSSEDRRKARAKKVNRFCRIFTPFVTGVFLLVYVGLAAISSH